MNELTSVRKMTKTFKKTEEQSNKKIHELQMKYEMAKDEKNAMQTQFDIRLNTLIRDFVKVYRNLGDEFLKYKEYSKFEIDILTLCFEGKNKLISNLQHELGEFKLALRIPRQHYKYIEKLRFEELMEQRDEIRARLKKKYGVDPTEPGQMMKMPDPNLPPEQQMEMMAGGNSTLIGN
jgi:hypothetical protein